MSDEEEAQEQGSVDSDGSTPAEIRNDEDYSASDDSTDDEIEEIIVMSKKQAIRIKKLKKNVGRLCIMTLQ